MLLTQKYQWNKRWSFETPQLPHYHKQIILFAPIYDYMTYVIHKVMVLVEQKVCKMDLD